MASRTAASEGNADIARSGPRQRSISCPGRKRRKYRNRAHATLHGVVFEILCPGPAGWGQNGSPISFDSRSMFR